MFRIQLSPEFDWPVSVELPTDGQKERHHFDARFKRLTQTQLEALQQEPEMTDRAFVERVLVGWRGIVGHDEQEIPYSAAAQARLLDIPGVATAIARAYLDAIHGGGARRKN